MIVLVVGSDDHGSSADSIHDDGGVGIISAKSDADGGGFDTGGNNSGCGMNW